MPFAIVPKVSASSSIERIVFLLAIGIRARLRMAAGDRCAPNSSSGQRADGRAPAVLMAAMPATVPALPPPNLHQLATIM